MFFSPSVSGMSNRWHREKIFHVGNFYYTTTTLAALHCDPKFLEATTTVLVNRHINSSKVPKHWTLKKLTDPSKTICWILTPLAKNFEFCKLVWSIKIGTFHGLRFILQGTVEPHHHHLFWPHRGWWHFIMTIFHRVYNFELLSRVPRGGEYKTRPSYINFLKYTSVYHSTWVYVTMAESFWYK